MSYVELENLENAAVLSEMEYAAMCFDERMATMTVDAYQAVQLAESVQWAARVSTTFVELV